MRTTISKDSTQPTPSEELRIRLADPNTTPRAVILEQNIRDKNLLIDLSNARSVKNFSPSNEFARLASDRFRGQWQWGTASYNIRLSSMPCRNNCSYCYIKAMGERFGWNAQSTPSTTNQSEQTCASSPPMICDAKKVNKRWRLAAPSDREMIFFPSSSDIFPEMVGDYLKVAKKIIDAGHQIFFVTKPTMESTTALIKGFEELGVKYINNLFVYITIGTDDDKILRSFESRSSLYAERLECLKLYAAHRFNTNVMMEPYLSNPIPIIPHLLSIISPTGASATTGGVIAIGRMNYSKSFVFDADWSVDSSLRNYLNLLYSKHNVLQLWDLVKSNERLFLKKDSIKAVLSAIE